MCSKVFGNRAVPVGPAAGATAPVAGGTSVAGSTVVPGATGAPGRTAPAASGAVAAGMDYGVGTTAGRDADGRFDGTLSGPFCYKDGKAEVIRGLAVTHGYDLAACFAYSDSVSDEPMLAIVGNPVAVNPDHELRLMAQAGGWRIVEVGRLRVVANRTRRAVRSAAASPGRAWTRGRAGVSRRREPITEPE